jgi:glycosyltransferase involved in cell wall biosynthesis
MKQISIEDDRFRPLRLRRNFGKSAALAAGLAEASGAVIATMDGDLQDNLAELPAMVALLDGPADELSNVVDGVVRDVQAAHSWAVSWSL